MTMRKEPLPEKPMQEELAGLKARVGLPVHASEAVGGGFLLTLIEG
jgi:hypothetical protein